MGGVQATRAAVFVDGAYLDNVKRTLYGPKPPAVDMRRFTDVLVEPAERVPSCYYHCMPYQSSPPTLEESRRYAAMDSFLYNVRRLPRFEVRLGKLARRPTGFEQKRVDILMAVDMVRMSWGRQIDVAALVTGDSDFVPAIRAAKDAGVVVKLSYVKGACHDELYDACDDRVELTNTFLDKFLLAPGGH